ncbi:unnamed protein product [Nesidiocoris tenuis]|uniref:Uncharacterized protein n=1 Tax=Nesidiocoris tenuis TaxID=355587 RepID=A0A6H5GNV7_9HEMI|nr:unnamed protein product [Nesidiocoris tenuis]
MWRGSRRDLEGFKTEPGGLQERIWRASRQDNLTEFNTAHNRRISMLGIGDDAETAQPRSKKKRKCITFSEEHELINPEDVDPSVGRFRNMVHTTVDIADPNAGPEMQRLKSELPTADRAQDDQPSKKKIYAKEAWPGKKPLAPLLLVSAPPTNFL